MAGSSAPALYEEVVRVTRHYLGPAARRFVDRQIVNHLDREPGTLRRQDLPTLTDWISLTLALVVEDEKLVNNFKADLEKLAAR